MGLREPEASSPPHPREHAGAEGGAAVQGARRGLSKRPREGGRLPHALSRLRQPYRCTNQAPRAQERSC